MFLCDLRAELDLSLCYYIMFTFILVCLLDVSKIGKNLVQLIQLSINYTILAFILL
jgi:hypothetical protein